MLRHGLALLALALVASTAAALPASAAEPIEGRWQEPNGRLLEFFSTGGNTYSNRVVANSADGGACSDKPGNVALAGSGAAYSGTITFYRTSDCAPAGDGRMEVAIAPDGQSMKVGYAQPSSPSCCSSEVDLRRVTGVQPIEGRWKFLDGVIDIVPDGAGGYAAKVIEPLRAACPQMRTFDLKLGGAGARYSGTVGFYTNNGCGAKDFDGNVTVSAAADGRTARFVASPPQGRSGTSTDTTIERVGESAATFPIGDLAAIVNGVLTDLQKRYRALTKTSGSRQRKAAYAGIRSASIKGSAQVKGHRADPGETKLQTCALKALAKVQAAARKAKRQIDVGRGLQAIAACLKSFRSIFPNDKPGSEPTKGRPAKPSPNPKRWNGWGASPYSFPSIDFDIRAVNGVAQIVNLDFAVRVVCFNGGGGVLTREQLPAMASAVAPIAANRSFSYTYQATTDRFSFVITGAFEKSYGHVRGTVRVTGRDCKNFSQDYTAWPAP